MIETAGGILLALLILISLPFLLRGIAGLLAVALILVFVGLPALFLFGTEYGRSLLPYAAAFAGIAVLGLLIGKHMDKRHEERRRRGY